MYKIHLFYDIRIINYELIFNNLFIFNNIPISNISLIYITNTIIV